MGLLAKLFHRDERPVAETANEAPACAHAVLLPHWDNLADMGHDEKATSFRCEACGQEFTPEQAQLMREHEAERLRQIGEETQEASQT